MPDDEKIDGKVPSDKPSFSSTQDDPLATAGTGGSEDAKGRVRPGGGEVPADSGEQGISNRPEEEPHEADTGNNPDRKPAKNQPIRDSRVH
jgi:hypothetical protein